MRPTREMRPRPILSSGLGVAIGGASVTEHVTDSDDAHDASAVTVSPTVLGESDVQSALEALEDASGVSTPVDHGDMGATETLDVAAGTWHRGTLNVNCAITVTGYTVDEAVVLVFKVEQNGTGNFSITWDADIVFIGDDQPNLTAASVSWFLLWSDEGDGTIYGAIIGGSSAGASTLDDLTDATITSPQADDTLRYVGGVWVNDDRQFRPVTHDFGSGPELVWDGDDLVMEWF